MSFLEKAIEDNGKMGRTIGLMFVAFALLFVMALVVVNALNPKIELKRDGATIVFQQSDDKRKRNEIVLVSPQGLNDTGLDVKMGDEITMSASGKINLAMGRINRIMENKMRFKDKYTKLGKGKGAENFSAGELKDSTVPAKYDWIDPLGTIPDSGSPKRSLRVRPDANFGQLLFIMFPRKYNIEKWKPSPSDLTQKIAYLPDTTFIAKYNGRIYFIVNDVNYKITNNIDWVDNSGFFHVKLLIEEGERK